MFEQYRVIGLIPARGGSKGIPRKNIKNIEGKPLISYTIEGAKRSKYLDKILVSTDSSEIANISKRCGADVPFLRPGELATDTSKTIDTVLHALRWLQDEGQPYDVVVLLQPTSPLRSSRDIDGAVELFFKTGMQGVVSVSETKENPILFRTIAEDGSLERLLDQSSTIRRQDMNKWYRVDGAIYVNKADQLDSTTSLNDNPYGYIVSREHGIDIDNIDDFREAEKAIRKRLHSI